MFIPELDKFDPKQAAAILSRLILDIESGGMNPAASAHDSSEFALREAILKRAQKYAHDKSSTDKQNSDIKEFIIDLLDKEADLRAEPVDEKAAVNRLSIAGELPNDVLKVFSEKSISLPTDSALDDRVLIARTIKYPDMSDKVINFEGRIVPGACAYAKYFNFGSEKDKFLLVVCGLRDGYEFHATQSLRIYASDVNLHGTSTPLEALLRWTDVYGVEFEVVNWRGKFLSCMKVETSKSKILRPLNFKQKLIEFDDGSNIIVTQTGVGPMAPKTESMITTASGPDGYFLLFGITVNIRKFVPAALKHIKREKVVFNTAANALINKII
ncbi:hypothetical protein [Methylobacterium indicum]|uniref:hypothetical protein n=1 Tax=Methylobacterium indicum TaxID=1775910 RepID=UPI000AA4B77C|nr:hypothetical protein [Methylobacterium indicum]